MYIAINRYDYTGHDFIWQQCYTRYLTTETVGDLKYCDPRGFIVDETMMERFPTIT